SHDLACFPTRRSSDLNLPFPGWFFEQRDFVVARFGSRLREGSPGGTAADHVQLAASLGLATNFCEPPLAFKAGNEIAQRHRIARSEEHTSELQSRGHL